MNTDRSVLIIDDDPVFTKVAMAVLESHGYRTDSAKDGREGLEKMRNKPPDLVLLDVMMPWVLEGVNVSREMMEDSRLRGIPLIICTSISGSEYRDAFPQDEYLHVDGWLDKPCPPDKLVGEIEAVLSHHEQFKKDA